MADKALDQLKGKYQSVLNKMQQLGVRLENVHLQDGKLFLKGRAKSKADSNQVWEQIKLINPSYQNEVIAEISFDEEAAQATQPKTYTVKKGDTLSRIAQTFYGDSSLYRKIFEANRDKLSDPDLIQPGQVLLVPA